MKDLTLGSSIIASFGGEVRQRLEAYDNEMFGLGLVKSDTYDLSRFRMFSDFRIANKQRMFVDMGWQTTFGKASPLAQSDRSGLDFHQLFVDMMITDATVRIGRQEMPIGSARFVDVREGPNVHQTFDGLNIRKSISHVSVEGFVVSPTDNRPRDFDDRPTKGQLFTVVYTSSSIINASIGLTQGSTPKPALALDGYYFYRRTGRYASMYRRYYLGARIWGSTDVWDYDLEAMWQLGRSALGRVSAGGASLNAGHSFPKTWLSPRLGLKANWFSGDRRASDGRDNTTDPLFPRGAYFSEPGLQTFSNIMDLQPSITANPTRRFALQFAVDFVARPSRNDAVYITPLVPINGTAGLGDHAADTNLVLQSTWYVTPNVTLASSLVYSKARSALTAAGGRDTTYFAAWTQFQFEAWTTR